MSLINKLFNKESASAKPARKSGRIAAAKKKESSAVVKTVASKEKKIAEAPKKQPVLASKILLSSHMAEKALMDQKLNHYVFKVSSVANKIMITNEIKKNYNVKVLKVNIINVPRKIRRVGKTSGFKSGYKKAIITLAPGQAIEAIK